MDLKTLDGNKLIEKIKAQQEMLKSASERQGQRPQDRKSKDEMVHSFMISSMMSQIQMASQRNVIHQSFIPPAYRPSISPLAELRPIFIRDLQLEIHHRGTYLLLKAITPASRMNAVLVIAEDERDEAIMVEIYHQETEDVREATSLIGNDAVLLIKEPYFKVMASGEYGLRIDHLSDIIFVDQTNSMIPTAWRTGGNILETSAESLKLSGHKAVRRGKYWESITMYTRAIAHERATGEEIEVILRNRAFAFLKTQQYDAVLTDLGYHPGCNLKFSEKALYRTAEALYSLGRFSECLEVTRRLHIEFPNNQQAIVMLDRVQNRCSEQQAGTYKFKQLQLDAKRLSIPQLDYATYVGPLEVRNSEGKGRGLFVTKAVKAGDLLICEKAFGYAHVAENSEESSSCTLLVNTETERWFMGGHANLLRTLAQKIHKNPSLAPSFSALFHGDYEGPGTREVDGAPVVDTFLVERIASLNVFGCPPDSSLHTHQRIIQNENIEEKPYQSCGIWIKASYINHSCVGNVRRAFVGDMMIVRASRDLEADTELAFTYKKPSDETAEANKKFLKTWGFTCQCSLCQDVQDTKESVLIKRRKLLRELEKTCGAFPFQLAKFERLLKDVDKTYKQPANIVPRLGIWAPYMLLLRMYAAEKTSREVLVGVENILNSLGFVVHGVNSTSTAFEIVQWGVTQNHLVEVFLHARDAFRTLQLPDDAERATAYARLVFKIVVGENDSFESVHGI
ncbi:unnamed protein product [Periconia digitata]|uniref:SET domain-containing protein n=1 Tax=Periconia digitata TaxID=1303443 RepID=A0A9W4UKG2_9PLEO|nr:unnamed protein product [Periconia digitata]